MSTLGCFEFLVGAGVGTSIGVYKSEQLKPVYDQAYEKAKEYFALAKEKFAEFREAQKVDVSLYKEQATE
ncbi:unnamed protein product [Amoebophrya sp. A120]|nr:unnamed protein product [Amoebophrya sp. A120]|eukprot:GSA120T00004112001.1